MTKPRKLLVTGASGMVGRNLLEHPLIRDWTVIAPRRSELDLSDRSKTEAFVRDQAPDVIVHAAGRVGGIQDNIAHPVDFLVSNLDIGCNVILAARHAGVPRLLNLASSCMYPRGQATPLREEQILTGELEPTNEGYAIAKIATTRLCQYIRKESPELKYKSLIPCNLYGQHDKFAAEHSHLVAAVIHKVHTAKAADVSEVEIWGDGTARREFMYTSDFADAVMRAISEIDAMPDLMNIGLGYDHTIDEYHEVAARVIGWRGRFVHDHARPVGMMRKLVDISRQTAWGWAPSVSLEEGIARAYDYYLREVL